MCEDRACGLTALQQQLCSRLPPDTQRHGGVSTLHRRLQTLPAPLWTGQPLTSDLLLAWGTITKHLKDPQCGSHREDWHSFILVQDLFSILYGI